MSANCKIGKSSLTCTMTGWSCLFRIISMISSMSALLSRVIEDQATSMSPPSLEIIIGFSACAWFRIAKALFLQIDLSHSSACCEGNAVCGGAVRTSGVQVSNMLSGKLAVCSVEAAPYCKKRNVFGFNRNFVAYGDRKGN